MLHILHNAIGNILASMADSPKFLKQLRTICNYFKHSQLRQYYQETCLVGDHARYSAMFKSWPAVHIEWRWGSLVECLKHMDGALCAVLRLTWDVSSMKKKVSKVKEDPNSKCDLDWEAVDDPKAIGDVIHSNKFWAFAGMLLRASEAAETISDHFNSCECHPATPTSQRRGLNPYYASDEQAKPCIMVGCFSAMLASGLWKNFVRKAWDQSEASLLPTFAFVNASDRAELMDHFMAGRDSVIAELTEKLAFWECLPHLLAGMSMEDGDAARVCARRCMRLYDNRGGFEAHVLTESMLSRASPLRMEVEYFSAGEDLTNLPGLECEIAKLSLIPVVERAVEAGHASAKQRLRLNDHPSPAAFSLSLRMTEMCMFMDSNSTALHSMANDFEKCRSDMVFIHFNGLVNHPTLATELGRTGKLREKTIESVFYHTDPGTKHVKHETVAKEWSKRRTAERKENKEFHKNLAKNTQPSKAIEDNVLAMIHDCASKHLSTQHSTLAKMDVIVSCRLVGRLNLESIEARYEPHDAAQTDKDASLDRCSAVDFESINATVATTAASDRLEPEHGAHMFFRVVNTSPSKRSIVVPVGSTGVLSQEMTVTVHQVSDLDFVGKSARMAVQPLVDDHLLWSLPSGLSVSELASSLNIWKMTNELTMVVKHHHLFVNLDIDVINTLAVEVVEANAVEGSDVRWHLVNKKDDPAMTTQLDTLVELQKRKLFTAKIVHASKSSWQITHLGLAQLGVTRTLSLCETRLLEPRATPLVDKNTWELLHLLDKTGFDLKIVAKGVKTKHLPIHDKATEELQLYARESAKGSFTREYFLALLLAKDYDWKIPHLAPIGFYRKLLHENNVVKFKALEDKKPKQKMLAMIDAAALLYPDEGGDVAVGMIKDAVEGDDAGGDGASEQSSENKDDDEVLDGDEDEPESQVDGDEDEPEPEEPETKSDGNHDSDQPDDPKSSSSSDTTSSSSSRSSSSSKSKKQQQRLPAPAGHPDQADGPRDYHGRRKHCVPPSFTWGNYYIGYSKTQWYITCMDESHHLPRNKCRRAHKTFAGEQVTSDNNVKAQRRLMWWALMAEHDTIDGTESHKELCARWRDIEMYNIPSLAELVTIRDGTPDVQQTMLTATLLG